MPTTYTHDLFGKKVYRQLPKEVKQVIRENGDLFRIGLHGPDILFYFMVCKNPVSCFGIQMHKEKARGFFQEGMKQVREKKSRPLLAYLLGFGCHYLLDSACHPYVDEMNDTHVISHTLLEKEFDRYLMEETGKNPYQYRPSDCISAKKEYAEVIHQALPLVRTGNILISLKMMKFLTNLMVCDDGGKRRERVHRLAGLGGSKNQESLTEYFMTPQPVEGCSGPVLKLKELFDEEAQKAPQELMELYELSREDKLLSDRWNLTYNG